MRLLLDEHFPPLIARRLRERGHDVIVVSDEPELPGHSDQALFEYAVQQRRAVVTADVADFRRVPSTALLRGKETYGVILVSPKTLRTRAASGRLIDALDRFLTEHPEDDALVRRYGGEVWL